METHTCQKCRHFMQHYAIADGRLFSTWCGLCVRSRGKHCRPDHRACEGFVAVEQTKPGRDDLKILLLQYLLDLERQKRDSKESEHSPPP